VSDLAKLVWGLVRRAHHHKGISCYPCSHVPGDISSREASASGARGVVAAPSATDGEPSTSGADAGAPVAAASGGLAPAQPAADGAGPSTSADGQQPGAAASTKAAFDPLGPRRKPKGRAAGPPAGLGLGGGLSPAGGGGRARAARPEAAGLEDDLLKLVAEWSQGGRRTCRSLRPLHHMTCSLRATATSCAWQCGSREHGLCLCTRPADSGLATPGARLQLVCGPQWLRAAPRSWR
jgi:hypothetical protein